MVPQLLSQSDTRNAAFAAVLATFISGNVLGVGVVFCGDNDEKQSKTPPVKTQKEGSNLISKFRIGSGLEWLSVDAIVTDPDNRDGESIKLDEVLQKAENIEAQGFDPEKVRMVLVQMPLDVEKRQVIFDANKKWRDEDVRFPKFDEKLVEFSCLGGNHLLNFLKMAKQATVCDSFVSVTPNSGGDAAISLNALAQSDPDFAKACTDKVPCIVLARAVRDVPDGLNHIQSSENAGHSLITPESDKQCMLRIAKATLTPDFDRVKTVFKLRRDFPNLKEHVDDYCSFVEAIGGGVSPHWHHWKICDARFTASKCHLRGTLLKKIADLPSALPRVKIACALAARSLPKHFQREGCGAFADWFTKNDIVNVEKHEDLTIAEESIAEQGAHVQDLVDNKLIAWILLARLDTRMARFLAKKTHKNFVQFESVAEIAEETKHEVANFRQTNQAAVTRSAEERRNAATSTSQVSIWARPGTRGSPPQDPLGPARDPRGPALGPAGSAPGPRGPAPGPARSAPDGDGGGDWLWWVTVGGGVVVVISSGPRESRGGPHGSRAGPLWPEHLMTWD